MLQRQEEKRVASERASNYAPAKLGGGASARPPPPIGGGASARPPPQKSNRTFGASSTKGGPSGGKGAAGGKGPLTKGAAGTAGGGASKSGAANKGNEGETKSGGGSSSADGAGSNGAASVGIGATPLLDLSKLFGGSDELLAASTKLSDGLSLVKAAFEQGMTALHAESADLASQLSDERARTAQLSEQGNELLDLESCEAHASWHLPSPHEAPCLTLSLPLPCAGC